MLPTTLDLVKAALRADQTVTVPDRNRFLKVLRNGDCEVKTASPPALPPKPKIIRRAEAAERLSRSVRSIDMLCASGLLQKVKFPGHKRFAGISETSLLALMAGSTVFSNEAP